MDDDTTRGGGLLSMICIGMRDKIQHICCTDRNERYNST